MTNEQAINLITRISYSQHDAEKREALEKAVRALEQNLVKESGDLVQDLVKDCISRQQAIDALDKHIDTFDAIDTNYLCGLRTAMSILKEMPSAQPERMTVEELRREAKSMGYNIVRIYPKEKLLPCICGSKRRGHWSTFVKGVEYTVLRCEKCEREASGRTDREARKNWNDMIRGESE